MGDEGDFVIGFKDLIQLGHVVVYGDQEGIFVYGQLRVTLLYLAQHIGYPRYLGKGDLNLLGVGHLAL